MWPRGLPGSAHLLSANGSHSAVCSKKQSVLRAEKLLSHFRTDLATLHKSCYSCCLQAEILTLTIGDNQWPPKWYRVPYHCVS